MFFPSVCQITNVTCHISCVTCHISFVRWHHYHKTVIALIMQVWESVHHPQCVTSHIQHVVFFGGGGGKGKIGASSGWWVCHPLGTPRLVLIRTTIVVYCNSIDSVENLKSAKYFRFSKISNFYIFEIGTFVIHTFAITPIWLVQKSPLPIATHKQKDPPQKFELQMCECHQTIIVYTALLNQRNANIKYSQRCKTNFI